MVTNPYYFIAIPLSASLKELFSNWQYKLKDIVSFKQWPHFEDLHITLKFLGAVDDTKLQQLKEELKVIEGSQEFSINVGKVGIFGSTEKPRVLWAGVDQTESLARLQQKVESCTANTGFAKESRAYRPHITLAKKWVGGPAYNSLEEIKEEFSKQQLLPVEEVVLYQIHPGKAVKYEAVAKYRLKRG